MRTQATTDVTGHTRGRPKKTDNRVLTRDSIITQTLKLVDEEGIEGLSMRKLGRSLGVDPMAVYHYIPNKAALLDAVVEAVMKEIRLPERFFSMEPREAVTAGAVAYWKALRAHPHAVRILATRPALNEGSLEYVENVLSRLLAAGFSERQSLDTVNAIGNYIRGCLAMDASHALDSEEHRHGDLPERALDTQKFPSLLRVVSSEGTDYHPERTFMAGLEFLIRGIFPGT